MNDKIKYPDEFYSADGKSKHFQNLYVLTTVSLYTLMFLAPALVAVSTQISHTEFKSTLRISSSILYVVSLVLWSAIKLFDWENLWYRCRSVAESIKSVTWKYVACVNPYDSADAKSVFHKDISDMISSQKGLQQHLVPDENSKSSSGADYESVRSLPFQSKVDFYRDERLKKQLDWYGQKSVENKNRNNFWFSITVLLQIIGAFSSFYILSSTSVANFGALISTIAALGIAWSQLKKFGELAISYSITYFELKNRMENFYKVKGLNELADFVADAENSISREQVFWIARRDHQFRK